MATPTRPLVLPELFMGDKSFEEWIDHFESVVGWDDADKLKWLQVSLSGRAGTCFSAVP